MYCINHSTLNRVGRDTSHQRTPRPHTIARLGAPHVTTHTTTIIGHSHSHSSAASSAKYGTHGAGLDASRSHSPSPSPRVMSTTATQCVRCERYHGESSSCVILPGNARCERCVIEVSTFDAADRIVIDDAVPALEIPVDDNARWMLVKPAAKKMASNAGKAITTKVAPQLNRTVARKSAPNKDEDEDVTKSLSAPAPHRTFPCVARKTAPASPPKVTKKSTAPVPPA